MRAACGGNTIYLGLAAENASMAFEQKTNHAMEIAGNCLYLQFRRAHTGPCGCGRRFMLGFASPALLGTKNGTDQSLRSARTCGRCKGQGGLPRDKRQWKISHLQGVRRPGQRICPQKQGVRRKPAPPTGGPPGPALLFLPRFLPHQHGGNPSTH